jgi:hypothetical protein
MGPNPQPRICRRLQSGLLTRVGRWMRRWREEDGKSRCDVNLKAKRRAPSSHECLPAGSTGTPFRPCRRLRRMSIPPKDGNKGVVSWKCGVSGRIFGPRTVKVVRQPKSPWAPRNEMFPDLCSTTAEGLEAKDTSPKFLRTYALFHLCMSVYISQTCISQACTS